jgi:hypothetical protein
MKIWGFLGFLAGVIFAVMLTTMLLTRGDLYAVPWDIGGLIIAYVFFMIVVFLRLIKGAGIPEKPINTEILDEW